MTATIETSLQEIPLDQIRVSKTNPRKSFDAAAMEEITASIRKLGVLTPILVRPLKDGFELVAGERRFRAAESAGLVVIPANVRDLSDNEALEAQIVENMQRQDIHPLEEAEGYRRLMGLPGYDVTRIAERVGRSVKYVYDRIKLLELIEPIKKSFLEHRITAGHAILLARLSPADQKLVSDKNRGGLWIGEEASFEEIVGKSDGLKPASVRELAEWIDVHCRFVPERDADPMLFPETSELLKAADPKKKSDKIVPISLDHVHDDARHGEKHVAPTSWKRADGKSGSKVCDFSVIGVVIAGEDRAKAFRVCTNKEKCATHWGDWQKARAKSSKASSASSPSSQQESFKKQQERAMEDRRRNEAQAERWNAAQPAILEALAVQIKKAPAGAKSRLAEIIAEYIDENSNYEHERKETEKFVPTGKSAEDFLRHLAFFALKQAVEDTWNREGLAKTAKADFGIDIMKIVEGQAVAKEKTKQKKK